MTLSTIWGKLKGGWRPIVSAAVWIAVWQCFSLIVGHDILLPSPMTVLKKMAGLVFESGFWGSVLFSLSRITAGFSLAAVASIVLAVLAVRSKIVRDMLAPLNAVIKATPVASIIILILIWLPSRNLSIILSMLVVFPIVYTNVYSGIVNTDRKLIEMANLFALSAIRRFRYIYLPQVFPYFITACSISLGMSWKSGIAAEVIGIPSGSIGERLYQAKVYLQTPELFAWTIVIIAASVIFEKLFLRLLETVSRHVMGVK
jgi:NitT/TauT family transport system permease protein